MHSIYLAKMDDNLQDALAAGLDFARWRDLISGGSTVFVKPNLTWPIPKPGVTTSIPVLDALLSLLSGRCRRLIVGESDGGTFRAEDAFATHQLPALCHRHGAELINLSRHGSVPLEDVICGRRVRLEVSAFLMQEVDVFVTVPTLKTHVVTRVTLGMKNQWGCIPSPMRLLYHPILDWGIVALNRAIGPRICILDGTYAIDRRGPLEGDPVPVGWLAVSDNVVALDAAGAHLMGIAPRSVRHIRLAEQEGLGSTDLGQARLNQPLPPPAIRAHIRPNLVDWLAIVIYHSWLLSKLAFDSPLTPLMYRVMRRTPPGTFTGGVAHAHPAGD